MEHVKSEGANVKRVDKLARLLYQCLIKSVTGISGGSNIEVAHQDYDDSVSFRSIARVLQNKVLFVDEAIPAARLKDQESREGLLRLIRNTVQALGMRAVVAGTASSLPNMRMHAAELMIRVPHFRLVCGGGPTKWIECELYWQHMDKDVLPESLKSLFDNLVLKKHRPLFRPSEARRTVVHQIHQ